MSTVRTILARTIAALWPLGRCREPAPARPVMPARIPAPPALPFTDALGRRWVDPTYAAAWAELERGH